MKKFSLLVVLVAASLASAAMVEDFEGAWAGAGTLVADPENAGNTALQLLPAQLISFVPSAGAGIVTMDIYDFGETSLNYGPRWGVADPVNATSFAATIIDKSFLANEAGYGFGTETSQTGSWWSPMWFGGPRQVDALETPAVVDDPNTPEDETADAIEPDGAWTTWTITVDNAGVATIKAFGVEQTGSLAQIGQIWVSGGKLGGTDNGVLVDNITFSVPEPATMSMLVLGGLALLRRRK